MKLRILDLVLLLVIVGGAVMTWQSGRERSRLSTEYSRLVAKTGDLPVVDPSQVYFRAIPTGDPMSFAWRAYLPPNYKQNLKHSGLSSGSSNGSKQDYIGRVRFREDEHGIVEVYTQFAGARNRVSLNSKLLADLLRGRWDKLIVEQLGSSGPAVLGIDKAAVVLELKLPPQIEAEARKSLSEDEVKRFVPSVFRLELSPETGKP